MYLIPISAVAHNRHWLLHNEKRTMLVDFDDAKPVLCVFEQSSLQLDSILVTHHHADDSGGVDALRKLTSARVYKPVTKCIAAAFEPLAGKDTVRKLDLRSHGKPTLPSLIEQEILINPFLVMRQAPVAAVVRRFDASGLDDDTEVFAALRQ